MTLTVSDADLKAMSAAVAVFLLGQLEVQTASLVQRIEALERRSGIEPTAFDLQSRISVDELAEALRAAMVTALAGQ